MRPRKHQWESFRGNEQNTAVKVVRDFSDDKPFEFKTEGLIWSTPVIDTDENIYVGSADKYFYALNRNGDLKWKYRIKDVLDSIIDSAATIVGDMVIIPGGDGFLHALDKENGEKIWEFAAYHADPEKLKTGEVVNSFEGNVVQHNSLLYAGSDNGYMYCIGLDGIERWSFETGMMIWSAACFHDHWMAFGSLDGYLYLLNSQTGELLDKEKIGEIKPSPAYDIEANQLFVGTSKGVMYSFAIKGDKLVKKWDFKAREEIYSSASCYDGMVFFASGQKFYCLDYEGVEKWSYNAYSKISSSSSIIDGRSVVFGAGNGKLYALNFKGERVWSYKTTRSPHKANLDSSPVISSSGNIYVGSYNGSVYKIPYAYCENSSDIRCEFGGKKDVPFKKGKNVRFEQRDGSLSEFVSVGISEGLKIRLTVFEGDSFVQNAAVNNVQVSISPKVSFKTAISGDGHFVTIIPETFWDEDTSYTVSVNINYYKRTNLVSDMAKRIALPKISEKLSFSTGGLGKMEHGNGTYGLHSFSIFQPISINTLIAAAMDGQQYVAEFSNMGTSKMDLKLTPAYETKEGFKKIHNPDREINLEGVIRGRHFYA